MEKFIKTSGCKCGFNKLKEHKKAQVSQRSLLSGVAHPGLDWDREAALHTNDTQHTREYNVHTVLFQKCK